jgi:hypothetical protein
MASFKYLKNFNNFKHGKIQIFKKFNNFKHGQIQIFKKILEQFQEW